MMMHNVANAPVSLYFDVTPGSRIVQAFTIDLKQIDSFVVEQSQSLINQVYFICGLIVMTWLHVPTLLPVMMLMAFRSFFKATENDTPNREINRLQRSV
jgi:ABC-type multidrug transport system fused ATPase/permease subunit